MRRSSVRRPRRPLAGLLVLTALSTGIGGAGCATSHATRPSRAAAEPGTAAELLRVARSFNADYAANRVGPVYDRWDAASRAIIGRAAYIRRHLECPSSPGPAQVQSARPAGSGWWTVRYTLGGTPLTDWWRHDRGRWTFDLPRSDPQSVALYRLSFAAYARSTSCRAG